MRVSAPRLIVLVTLGFAPAAAPAADCNGNGIPDIDEIRSGAQPDCNGTGIPDSCDIAPVNYGLVSAGSFFVGQTPLDIVLEDLDRDGDTDIAAASASTHEVTVLRNDGQGRFSPAARWSADQPSFFLLAGDFDGDSLTDLAVGGQLGLSILFQTPEGRFTGRKPILPIEPPMQGLAAGDLDGDSDADLAVAVPFGVRILENEDKGAFVALDPMPLGSNPVEIIAVGLDGDADLDLATANSMPSPVPTGNVSVLVNRGDGSFETARNYATGPDPVAMASSDLDGDGDPDLATASPTQGKVTILLGDGQGRFAQLSQLDSRGFLQGLVSADVDGDGDMDLAASATEGPSPGGVFVFLNHGRGDFTRPVEFRSGFHPQSIRSADIDGDRAMDLVIGDLNLSAVTVLQRSEVAYSTDCNSNLRPDDCEVEGNDCNGNGLPDECDIASRESADCDRDGTPDECQPDCNGNRIPDACDIISGFSADCNRNNAPDDCDIRGTGLGFEPTSLAMASFPRILASGDLDADGRQDLYALADPADLLVFWNGGSEGFLREVRFPAGLKVTDTAAGDLDGDADRDIILADAEVQGLRIVENTGSRTFGKGNEIPAPIGVNMVATADIDGDSDIDIAATKFEGSLVVFENLGGASFRQSPFTGGGVSGRILEVADLDGDGRVDLAADGGQQDSLLVFWNDGALAFRGPTILQPRAFLQAAGIADVDGDGDLDIFLSADRLVLFRNSGDRSFTFEDFSPNLIQGVGGILPGDLDRDGDQDLAAVFFGFQLAAILNRGGGAFDLPIGIAPIFDAFSLPVSGDWNGDGGMDLALVQAFFCPDCPVPVIDPILPPPPPGEGPQLLFLTNITKPPASRDADANGVPDECQPRPFHRADANGDGQVNLTDAVFTLGHLFQGEPAPPCLEAADTNNDAQLGITDPIATLEFLFRSGPAPAFPGAPPAPCGFDTDPPGSPEDIGCGAYEGC